MTRVRIVVVAAMTAMATVAAITAAGEDAKSVELKRVLDRIMAPPKIRTEHGFTARVLIAPGETKMYDPLFMHDQAGKVWINDDGGQEGDKGGQILAIDPQGRVSDVVPLGRIFPAIGFDIAPASFTPYGGQIFTVSQVEADHSGADKGHVVQRIDPRTEREGRTFCTLPRAGGADGKGIPSWGMEGRFGPDGSLFAGKFFAVTMTNGTVYQLTSDGRCMPFVSFDRQKWGGAFGLTFSPDGRHMLVSMLQQREGDPGKATIARVRADGTIETESLMRSNIQLSLWGMAYAPAGFGDYGGQLFVAARGGEKSKELIRKTHTTPEAGEVYRLTPEGELKRVASGFRFAVGVHFVGNRLWVSDANGDFIGGFRELPDGFIVEITPAP